LDACKRGGERLNIAVLYCRQAGALLQATLAFPLFVLSPVPYLTLNVSFFLTLRLLFVAPVAALLLIRWIQPLYLGSYFYKEHFVVQRT
jgi:hypothetical protein